MPAPLTTPDDDTLASLDLRTTRGDDPWVRSLTLSPDDATTVTVTWDEVAASAYVLWTCHDVVVAELTRETVDAVWVEASGAGHLVTITSRTDTLAGALTVTATPAGVRLHDSLLRT